MDPDLDKINFSNQRTAIPFGKFETGQDDVFPCNESMIGREGARAKLIDFLINAGTRKAILITGRRGMGKTSFVQYCLKEYEEARIERFWHSNFGRSAFSLIWLLVISFVIVGSFLIGGRFLQYLLHDFMEHHELVLLLPLGLLVSFLAYPLLLAGKILIKLIKQRINIPSIFVISIIALILFALEIIDQTISPFLYLGCLIITLAVIYFSGEYLGFISPKTRVVRSHILMIFGFIFSLWVMYRYDVVMFSEYLIFTFLIILIGIFLKISSLIIIFKNKKLKKSIMASTIKKAIYQYGVVIIVGVIFYLYILSQYENKENLFTKPPYLIYIYTFIILLIFIPIVEIIKEKNQVIKPNIYPSAVLGIKALFFIVLSFVAIQPLIGSSVYGFLELFKNCSLCIKLAQYPVVEGLVDLLQKYQHNMETNSNHILLFNKKEEWRFLVFSMLTITLIFWVEYEWIIRPIQYVRRDISLYTGKGASYYNSADIREFSIDSKNPKRYTARKHARENTQDYYINSSMARENHRVFEKLTFLYYFNYFHLTSLVSTINLGFEELDHRSVIHAMLIGIREQYYSRFLSLRNISVLIRYIFGLLIAMLLVSFLSKTFFNSKKTDSRNTSNDHAGDFSNLSKYTLQIPKVNDLGENGGIITIRPPKNRAKTNKYCQYDNNVVFDHLPSVPRLFCELGGFYAETVLPALYFNIFPIHLYNAEVRGRNIGGDILSWPFDIRIPYYEKNKKSEKYQKYQISLTAYHLLLFFSILFIFRRLNRAFWLIPYSLNLEKIDDLLDALTSTTNKKQNRDFPILARWVSSLSGSYHENEKNTTRSKLDPRAVELGFMSILQDISHSPPIYFKPLQSDGCSPFIEFTFVFDELDKLATDIYTQQQQGDPDSNDSELHRLHLMKGMLSNMKRIITASEARFIFLGGRLLHDDWLADGARRQPLLTSIFSDEIYLPSLLTDANIDWFRSVENQDTIKEKGKIKSIGNSPIHQRVEEYFVLQYYLARVRFEHWATRIWSPVTGFPEQEIHPRGFTQVSYAKLRQLDSISKTPLQTIPLHNTDKANKVEENANIESIPSDRAESRLEAFVHFLAYRSKGNPKRLNELLTSFMVSVDRAVPNQECRDKYFKCQDVLYLPDHKVIRIQLIARIYQQLRKGFEEKIRGRDDKTIAALIYMSDFLFKFHRRAFSWENLELIDELIHMHRGHDLRSLLHELVDHYSDRYLHRIINGMYSYRFRSYFANEIEYLSRHSEEEMAAFNFTLDEGQMLRDHLEKQLKKGSERDKTDILNMLGEMHEFYQEYERARYYYRQCIAIRHQIYEEYVGKTVGKGDNEAAVLQAIYSNLPEGRKALRAMQNWAPSSLRLFLKIVITYEKEHNDTEALSRCKFSIKFAEAMVQAFASLEKEPHKDYIPQSGMPSDRGSNLSGHVYVLEHLGLLFEPLFAYAWLLEKDSFTSGNSFLVLKEGIKNFYDKLDTKNERLKFIEALLNKKTGALCFYKGLAKMNEGNRSNKTFYVDKARNYYSDSADNLSCYFRKHAKMEYINNNPKSFPEALNQNHYPADYCLSIAECLGDLSESILARIEPIDLIENGDYSAPNNIHGSCKQKIIVLVKQLDQLFFDSKIKSEYCVLDKFISTFYDNNNSFDRLDIQYKFDLALNLSLASSFYLLRSGYVESAAREAMHSAEIVAQYLNWYWFNLVTKGESKHNWQGFSVVSIAMEKIEWFTTYLPWLLREVRFDIKQKPSDKPPYLMGGFIPSSALTTLCSIGLSLSFFVKTGGFDKYYNLKVKEFLNVISKTVLKWTGDDNENDLLTYEFFQEKLIYSLQRHRYPVLNQLNALKTLVDASLIKGYLTNDPDATKNTTAWLQELFHINKKYDHPLHFTPMQSGHSFYLYCYVKEYRADLQIQAVTDFDIDTETRQLLVQSLDICHMGRGYYKAIDKLYYLYDDFNDNQIHRNHSMQMAGAELTKRSLGNFQEISSQLLGITNGELLK
jgi:hypothetical protein